MIGKSLAHYDVTEQLGAGGMGEVYRARDTRLDRDVALKILPESFAADAERLSRFEREAKLLAGLKHANIAAIHGIEEADNQRFLVLELVEGVDLAKRLAEGPLIVEDALAVAYQIADALEAAHEQGVVHRDLKPANVMVAPDGTVKVLDFGLGKIVEGDAGSSNLSHSPTVLASSPTVQGVILGTAAYMSPEQARGKIVDRRADIWSFGVVLYEMLSARQLFGGETVSDTLASVIKTEPDWDALPKDTPRAIVALLKRCLEKDPRTRLRDIGEARVIIDRVLRGEIKDDAAALGETAPASTKGRIAWIAGMVVVAVVAAGAAWTLRPGEGDAPLRKFSILVGDDASASPRDAKISPDGSKIVYVLDNKLFVQELDELHPREVASESNPRFPCWSPDGETVCYVSDGRTIWKVPASGGASVKICEPPRNFTTGSGLAWTPDDRIVFAQANEEMFVVSANGGDPKSLIPLLENETDQHEPSVLPDGKSILFVSHLRNDSPDKIDLLLPDGERKVLVHIDGVRLGLPIYSPSGHILFTRTGTSGGVWAVPFSLAKLEVTGDPFPVSTDAGDVSISRDGTLVYRRGATTSEAHYVWVSRDGSISEPFTDAKQGLFAPALSPDGKRVAISEWDGSQDDIWMHDLQRGTATRFTFGESNEWGAEWTPDGKYVLYTDERSDSIMMKNADGTGAATAITSGEEPSISSDGKYIVYWQSQEPTGNDIWYYGLDGQSPPRPLVATPAVERHACISRDGNYVAYESNESGVSEIYLTRFPSGEGKWQVSTDGGIRPRWGPDGKTLYYQQPCDLYEVTVSLNPSPVLGTPVKILDCGDLGLNDVFGRDYEIDLDGSRFMFTVARASEGSAKLDVGITLVENWTKEFKK